MKLKQKCYITCLNSLIKNSGFDISEFIKTQKDKITHNNIFDLYSKLQKKNYNNNFQKNH